MKKTGRPAVEDPKDKRVSMRVTEKDYQYIVTYAKKQKITVAELINRSVKEYIEKINSMHGLLMYTREKMNIVMKNRGAIVRSGAVAPLLLMFYFQFSGNLLWDTSN